MKKYLLAALIFSVLTTSASGAIVYQNFEPDNGTPPPYGSPAGTSAEYGWGFNGTAVGLNDEKDPVHSGRNSWKVTIPAGEPVHAGSAVPAQVQTYNVNFIPECHDRLTFWVWAAPSTVGDHTAMVKFFDQGQYKQQGIGIWTTEPARYQQWTKLTILFSQLPADFNLRRVDKIEFFNYWDGTYYYDDIVIGSSAPPENDVECLKKEKYLSCLEPSPAGSPREGPAELAQIPPSPERNFNPILGIDAEKGAYCFSVFARETGIVLDAWQIRAQRRGDGLKIVEKYESR